MTAALCKRYKWQQCHRLGIGYVYASLVTGILTNIGKLQVPLLNLSAAVSCARRISRAWMSLCSVHVNMLTGASLSDGASVAT